VHGKGSMIDKMPGSEWEKFANLRAYYAYMWTHPGKKLLFMGCEFAQPEEWDHNGELNWALNTDAAIYGGGNRGNLGGIDATDVGADGHDYSVSLTLPPLSVVVLRLRRKKT